MFVVDNSNIVNSIDTQCRGKQRMSAGAARQTAKAQSDGTKTLQAYLCPHCNSWHIGKPTGHNLKAQFNGGSRGRKFKHPRDRGDY